MTVGQQRKLLVLDLDETLLYATDNRLAMPEAFRIGRYYAYLRPHLPPFLEFCAARFDVAVWTASSADYAKSVATQLFGSLDRLAFLWSRERCTMRYDRDTAEYYWVKDLKKIRRNGYALEQVIVVDDTAKKHERNYGNLVRVEPFEGQLDDDELVYLTSFLETLVGVDDVRVVDKRGWRHKLRRREDVT